MPDDCLFCRMASGAIPVDKVHEDDLVFAIRDINPQAPTHVLVIPVAARRVRGGPRRRGRRARSAACSRWRRTSPARDGLDGGWRLVTNVGPDGGQSVHHLHVHLLGGRRMAWPPG